MAEADQNQHQGADGPATPAPAAPDQAPLQDIPPFGGSAGPTNIVLDENNKTTVRTRQIPDPPAQT